MSSAPGDWGLDQPEQTGDAWGAFDLRPGGTDPSGFDMTPDAPPRTAAVDTARSDPPGTRTARRGRSTVATAAVLTGIATVLMGGGLYAALSSIHLVSIHPMGDSSEWFTVVVIGAVAAFVAFVWAVVATVRARSLASVVVLLAAIAAPPLGVMIGVDQGVDQFQANVQADLGEGGDAALSSVSGWAKEHGVDVSPIVTWLTASH